ncbi:response regulator [Egbenema bharatensis]|uniref:response regulator n=1 Tax=Egbenema bharatensis TaxID=3463334 RepID=UPI003A8765B7
MKILLVEDDAPTAQFLSAALTADQYAVDVATDGQTGLELAQQWEYDLMVLDVMIPRLDGISVCRQLRSQSNQTPILLLTAKGANEDIVTGLDAGADDYLTKPFDLSQLLARIRALLRRGGGNSSTMVLTWGELTLNMVSAQVTYRQQSLDLRPREYKLLELFLRHPLRVFSRNAIIDQIWTSDDFPSEGAVTNLIKDLRQRLKKAGVEAELIETVYGLGYRLRAAPEKGSIAPDISEPTLAEESHPIVPINTFHQARGMAAIAQAIEWFQASLEQRIKVLEAAEQALQQGTLTPQQREQAKEEAHKLIGGAGIFGYPRGVPFAQRLEELLTAEVGLDAVAIQEDFSQQLAALKQVLRQPPSPIPEAALTENPKTVASPNEFIPALTITSVPAPSIMASSDIRSHTADATVVLIGDDTVISNSLTETLQPWGIQVVHLTQPDRFWQVLTTITPDLLLLDTEISTLNTFDLNSPDLNSPDLNSPDLNSLEFCRTVRQNANYGDLPIVVITAQTDPTLIQQMFAAGADDFISKPVIGSELVSRVVNRIERSRTQRPHWQKNTLEANDLTQTDPITYLANRWYFDRYLRQIWQISLREQSPFVVILGDIDYFNLYNDRYGYTVGNRCLQQIAAVLQQCIHTSDRLTSNSLVARYAGGTFAMLLPQQNLDEGVRVVQAIQREVANLNLLHDRSPISAQVTLSLGITGTIPAATREIEALLNTADQALAAAKWRGRNTYCLYPL